MRETIVDFVKGFRMLVSAGLEAKIDCVDYKDG